MLVRAEDKTNKTKQKTILVQNYRQDLINHVQTEIQTLSNILIECSIYFLKKIELNEVN